MLFSTQVVFLFICPALFCCLFEFLFLRLSPCSVCDFRALLCYDFTLLFVDRAFICIFFVADVLSWPGRASVV